MILRDERGRRVYRRLPADLNRAVRTLPEVQEWHRLGHGLAGLSIVIVVGGLFAPAWLLVPLMNRVPHPVIALVLIEIAAVAVGLWIHGRSIDLEDRWLRRGPDGGAWSFPTFPFEAPVELVQTRTPRHRQGDLLWLVWALVAAVLAVVLLKVGAGSASVVPLGLFAIWVGLRRWQLSWVGSSTVGFEGAPFFPGGRVRVRFGQSPRAVCFRSLCLSLTCRTDEYVAAGYMLKYRSANVSRTLEAHEIPEPGSDVEIDFDLPSHAPGSEIRQDEVTYWLLEVVGETSGPAYRETFLVPVVPPA